MQRFFSTVSLGFIILFIFFGFNSRPLHAYDAPGIAVGFEESYQIHVVAASTRATAQAIAERLKMLFGHETIIIESGEEWLVRIDGIRTEAEAQHVQKLLAGRGIGNTHILFRVLPDSRRTAGGIPQPDNLNIRVSFTDDEITLDGRLSENAWKQAETGTHLWQFFPQDRIPATERTFFKLVQDETSLYIGILCLDSEPDGIVAKDMRRDSGLGDDDYIGVYLDTFHDHRNFYYFSTNPLGTRRDGVVTDANYYNTDWDGIWQCAAVKNAYGWSAEFRIPFSTLRFGGEQPMTWGFNLSRQVRRKQEKAYWAPIPRELGQKGTWRGELFGQITGVRTAESTSRLELEPYALGGGQRVYNPASTDSRFDYGGDVRYHFSPNLRGDLSFNTDFAQVEADQEVVNFTRFPIFFPEKREFFLENAGLFTYGYPGDVQFFYSRRIGLSEGTQIPLFGAAKLSGRIGDYSLGIMSVETEETRLPSAPGAFRKEPETNYSVLRVKRDIFSNSSFGVIVTNKQTGGDYYNRLFGADANIWFHPSLKGEVIVGKSFTPGLDKESICGVGRLHFMKNNFTADLRYYEIAPDYNPEMGFVGATDLTQSLASLGYTQWVNRAGIQNIGWSGTYWYDTRYNHDFWVWWLRGGANVTFNSGDAFSYHHAHEVEDVPYEFSIGPVDIFTKYYTNRRHIFQFSSNPSRPISGTLGYTAEDYWDGERRQFKLSHNFHPVARLSMDLSYTYNTVDHPQAVFNTNTLSNRILYAVNTDFFAKTFIQWNDFDKRVSANFLLSYMYRPGSDIYLVYNEIRDRLLSPTMEIRNRILLLKMTYNMRI